MEALTKPANKQGFGFGIITQGSKKNKRDFMMVSRKGSGCNGLQMALKNPNGNLPMGNGTASGLPGMKMAIKNSRLLTEMES